MDTGYNYHSSWLCFHITQAIDSISQQVPAARPVAYAASGRFAVMMAMDEQRRLSAGRKTGWDQVGAEWRHWEFLEVVFLEKGQISSFWRTTKNQKPQFDDI